VIMDEEKEKIKRRTKGERKKRERNKKMGR
jgi:hypothetical protein